MKIMYYMNSISDLPLLPDVLHLNGIVRLVTAGEVRPLLAGPVEGEPAGLVGIAGLLG